MLRSADSFLAICEKFDSGNDEAEIRQWRLGSKNSWRMSGCLSIYHFVPFAFVIAILVTSILVALKKPFLAIAMWITYWCGAIGMAILSVKMRRSIYVSFCFRESSFTSFKLWSGKCRRNGKDDKR